MGYSIRKNVERLAYKVALEKGERRKSCTKAVQIGTIELDSAARACYRERAAYDAGRASALEDVQKLLERIMNEQEVPDAH